MFCILMQNHSAAVAAACDNKQDGREHVRPIEIIEQKQKLIEKNSPIPRNGRLHQRIDHSQIKNRSANAVLNVIVRPFFSVFVIAKRRK